MSGLFDDADYISIYSRAQALADGLLIDVTEAANGLFRCPVAMTLESWLDCVRWDEAESGCHQQQAARLRDVLMLAHQSARRHPNDQVFLFALSRVRPGRDDPEDVQLQCHAGPGDNAELVITISQPGED